MIYSDWEAIFVLTYVLLCGSLRATTTRDKTAHSYSMGITGWSSFYGMRIEGVMGVCPTENEERQTSDQDISNDQNNNNNMTRQYHVPFQHSTEKTKERREGHFESHRRKESTEVNSNCTAKLKFKQLYTLPEGYPIDHPILPGEGITLTVVNQRKGNLILHKVFPLSYYWAYWCDLQWYMKRIASGRIVLLTVCVSGSNGLRNTVKQLTEMGSIFAQHLTPSARWTWIFVKGGRTISETAVIEGASDTYVHTVLPVNNLPSLEQLTTNKHDQERWHYCETEDGLGDLCDEDSPASIPFTPSSYKNTSFNMLKYTPVIITAGRRHQYLYYTLTTLFAAAGVIPENFLVILGDAPKATTELLNILGIKYAVLEIHGQGNAKLFRYYRGVYNMIAERFPTAPTVIILDEDVEVSPDFFFYMQQTLWLLKEDPSIYCISGFGRPPDLAHNYTKLYRGVSQVSWGYAVTLDFIREALPIWLNYPEDKGGLYDYWLYEHVAHGRECVFPEFSRSRHYGLGVNTVDYLQEKFFLLNPLVPNAGIELNQVERLMLSSWHQDLTSSILNAKVLSGNPCSLTFLPKAARPTTFVFYVSMKKTIKNTPDISDYYLVAHCLGAWGLSPQWLHDGVATFTTSVNVTIHVVGVPYSSFAQLRHSKATAWTAENVSDVENKKIQDGLKARNTVLWTNMNLTSHNLMNKLLIPS
ncbi:hypothetical protein SK128_014284 [Halocaridina rubra]|uniref:Alpha-1,3-mannosyl-glycoprotein 2-beta-N-acetylglucosaminyltransferase n=1 Tax=Halocaridina rubra TaxID=373956 RepID=A0AAN8WPF5_HALRR